MYLLLNLKSTRVMKSVIKNSFNSFIHRQQKIYCKFCNFFVIEILYTIFHFFALSSCCCSFYCFLVQHKSIFSKANSGAIAQMHSILDLKKRAF